MAAEPLRTDVGSYPHKFEKRSSMTPTWCSFCDNFIFGLPASHYACKDCKYTCHPKCLENVPNMCLLGNDGKKLPVPDKSPRLLRSNTSTTLKPIPASPKTRKDKDAEKKEKKKEKDGQSVSSPFNLVHNTHVDFDFNWSGDTDPKATLDFKEELGRGAYGGVFKACHRETGFEFAIKVLPLKPESKKQLEKEIDVFKKCRHANILSYYGTLINGEEVWVLMDCCSVGSLKDVMNITLETFEEEQIRYITREALKGLTFLHANRIIHCDIKAANILLTNSGQVKLADFGVSEQIQRGTMRVTPNDFVGSPLYMAPEVIEQTKYGIKADMWSLGVTLIELAEGRPPNNDIKNMTQLLTLPKRPPPTLKNPKLWSPMFSSFLTKILVKEPEKRLDTIEMLQEFFVQNAPNEQCLMALINLTTNVKQRKAEKAKTDLKEVMTKESPI